MQTLHLLYVAECTYEDECVHLCSTFKINTETHSHIKNGLTFITVSKNEPLYSGVELQDR